MNKILSIFILLASTMLGSTTANAESLNITGGGFRDTADNTYIINPGDTVQYFVPLQAASNLSFNNVTTTLSSSDSCVTITQNTITYGTVTSAAAVNGSGTFVFKVAPLSATCTTGHTINFTINTTANGYSQTDNVSTVLRDALQIMGNAFTTIPSHSSNIIEPSDIVSMTLLLQAVPYKTFSNVQATLSSSDPCMIYNINSVSFGNGTVDSNSVQTATFNFSIAPASATCATGHQVPFTINITTGNNYSQTNNASVLLGEQTMQAISWSTASNFNIIQPVSLPIGGSCGPSESYCQADGNVTEQYLLSEILPELQNRPAGTRIIQLWQEADDIVCYAVPSGYKCAGLDSDGDPDFVNFQTNPMSKLIQNKQNYFQKLSQDLQSAGISSIDMIVMDMESGWSIWGFPSPYCGALPTTMQRIFNNYGSGALYGSNPEDPTDTLGLTNNILELPYPVGIIPSSPAKQVVPGQVVLSDGAEAFNNCDPSTDYGHQGFIDWDEFAGKELQAIYQTAIIGQLKAVYPAAVASQYQDNYATVAMSDTNGWPITPSDTQLGDTSSPALYIFGWANEFLYDPHIMPWNIFIDEINEVRADMAGGHPVVPWLGYPGQNQDGDPRPVNNWFWEQMMQHMAATGVSQAHYFNPGIPQTADQDASNYFAKIPVQSPQTNLLPIPYTNTCTVNTGNFSTTYADFISYYLKSNITYAMNTQVCVNGTCTTGLSDGNGNSITTDENKNNNHSMNICGVTFSGHNQSSYIGYVWVTATANPGPGYQFTGWSGSASATTLSTDLMMTADQNLTANFTPLMPTVNASANQTTITLPSQATLTAAVTPSNATVSWSQVSGPGTATFSSSTSLSPTVSFTQSGTYVLCATVSANGLQAASNVTVYVNPPLPSAPGGLTAIAGNEQVGLTWTAGDNATSYILQRSTDGTNYISIASGITNTSYTDGPKPPLTNGTTYYYEVQSADVTGNSAWSSSASALPEPPAPSTPQLTAAAGDSQVNLTWTTSAGASTYTIKRSNAGGPDTYFSGITGTTYLDKSTVDGTTYYYEIQAVNGGGTSPLSSAVIATPLKIYTITAAAGGGGSISPSGAVAVTSGSSQTFNITASSGYVLTELSVDGQDQALPLPSIYPFNNVTGQHLIQANFSQVPVITSQPLSQIVPAGQKATFSVAAIGTAPLSYQWSRNGKPLDHCAAQVSCTTLKEISSTDNGDIYTVVVSNLAGSTTSQSAVLTTGYTLNVTAPNGGVTVSPSQNIYAQGTKNVTLTPTQEIGYAFSNWSGDIVGATVNPDNSLTLLPIGQNLNITANYVSVPTYSLTVNMNPSINGGSVKENPAQSVYNQNSGVILTATPPAGYQFASWSGTAGTVDPQNPAEETVYINSPTSVTANFTPVPVSGNPAAPSAQSAIYVPVTNAATNQIVALPNNAVSLNPSVSGMSNSSAATYSWSSDSANPGPVTFSNANDLNTTATFTTPGTYTLILTADDGTSITNNDVTVTVNPS